MAPILIDSRDLLKLGSAFVLFTALVFAAGFFMGHQRAAEFYQAGSEMQSLSLPEKAMLAENILDAQVPEVVEAGEDIDVDQPETTVQLSETSQDSMPDSVSKKPATKSQNVSVVSSSKESSFANQASVAQTEISVVNRVPLDDLSKIKYSVQVGMYGRLLNAENMVKMLQAQQYDAYVSDYTNKKNEIRYNVRFGYFTDKKSAIARLKKFRAEQKSDGYLVKFSATNIVNVAGAIDVPVKKNQKDKVLVPPVPLEQRQNELLQTDLSQAEILSNKDITTN